jgi:hypothetical protein
MTTAHSTNAATANARRVRETKTSAWTMTNVTPISWSTSTAVNERQLSSVA